MYMLYVPWTLLSVVVLACTKVAANVRDFTTELPPDGFRGPIFLSEPPSTVVIPNTKGAMIPCAVYGNPTPKVTWLNGNGEKVVTKSGVIEVLTNHSLFFPPFDATSVQSIIHTQVYTCKAENLIGRIVSREMNTVAVIVEQLERFSVTLNDAWVMRGGTAIFTCVINPPFWQDYVKVTGWIQGQEPILPGERIRIMPNGELHVRDVRDTDGYTDFRCTASSNITITKSSPRAKLIISEPPAGGRVPSIADYPSQGVEIHDGGKAELPCVSDGWPLPTYRWYKNGALVDLTDNRYSQLGGNLVITSSRTNDSGEYRCNATNSRGTSAAVRKLTVIAALSASINPATQVVDSGQSAVFNCTVTGHPVTAIKWYKDGEPLSNSDHVIYQSDTLVEVQKVQRGDQGMYQCFVVGTAGEMQSTAQLLLGAAHPSMMYSFADQFVRVGQEKTSIRCIAAGNPTPSITWTLDGEVVRIQSHVSVGDYTTPSGDVYSYVNITSVRLQDGGEYRCIARNDVGQVEHVGRLNVYGIPYIREMRNITATANERLSIRCYVTGYPIDRIIWLKNGRALPLNHLQQVINGTLTILKVQKLYDAGKYTCEASNSASQGMSRDVYVSVLEPPVIDPFRIPPRKQGDRVTLSCAVSSGDLPIYINWTKDGKEIPHDMGIVVETSGSYSSLLKIGDVSPKHDGNYTCHAHNQAASTNFTAILNVDVPPSWSAEPEDTSVIRLENVAINCSATGIPPPQIMWSKDIVGFVPLDLTLTDHYFVSENGTLVIMNVREEDDGNYLCRADNQIGHGISKIISLKVHVPARFDAAQTNYTVLRGRNITMDCQAIGDKPLSVSWNFRNTTFGNGATGIRHIVGVQPTYRGQLSQMSLRPANREDTGMYTCTAQNKYGQDDMTTWLTVLESPDAPKNFTVLDIKSRFVVLRWSKPYNGNSPILNYIIEYQNTTGTTRGPVRNVSVPGGSLTATLDNLHPSFLYIIRIRANNTIGLGLTSHQVSAHMLEEAPTGPPLDVDVKAIGSQKLQVTWKPPALENRNGVIQGYFVGYKESQSTAKFQFLPKDIVPDDDDPEAIVNILIPSLKKFTEYTVNVKSYNKEGTGPACLDIKVSTLEDVPSQPPEGVHAFAISSQSIKVVWGPPPLFTLHGVLQGYKVLYKPVREDEDETDANFVKSSSLEVTVENLERYTNYSIQVLAFTRKGEGVRSNAIFVKTMEDVPGRPSGIKALAVNNSSVIASWQLPSSPNGVLTSFNIYFSNTSATAQEMKIVVSPHVTRHVIEDLESLVNYWVRVTASTRMGEGESTQIVTVTPFDKAPAKITSFSRELVASWQDNIMLECLAVGEPDPEVTWNTRHGPILENDPRRRILSNGSLYLEAARGSDADNYTCDARNKYGSDVITYSISVQIDTYSKTPPKPPILSIAAVTSSTIQVNWLSASNGGSAILDRNVICGQCISRSAHSDLRASLSPDMSMRLSFTSLADNVVLRSCADPKLDCQHNADDKCCLWQGFSLRHRKEHEVWQEVTLDSKNRTYTAVGLFCGTQYKFSITAVNGIGRSESSNVISVKTNGSVPIEPAKTEILKSINVTSVELDMRTWRSDFCPINFYSIKYQVWGESTWVEVTNSISWNTTLFPVEDLSPATWYIMKVSAHSDAGSKECNLKFATLTYSGSTLEPLFVLHKQTSYFYERPNIMIPLCGAFIILLVLTVGIALYCSRRRQLIRYKENSSNIRRDITAETSLMNDLDKRVNYELESPQDARFNSRNVNLLISLNSDENLVGNNGAWCFHGSSKTNSDNASLERSEEDANINPYATFNELKLVFNENPTYHKADPDEDSDEDSVSMEKAEAQKAMLASSDGSEEPKYASKGTSPPPVEPHSYDNQGVVLSPRKYASADQIHALFTMAPPRPQSAYSKNRSHGTRSTPSDKGTGSQRHSLISSVTTVSSSRDELLEAFENLNRNPPPPVVYETEADSLSQPTDSSTGTEPGICLFTQSPPQPDEQREASCEVPRYESPEESHYHHHHHHHHHNNNNSSSNQVSSTNQRQFASHCDSLDNRGSSRRTSGKSTTRGKDTMSRGTSMSKCAGRHKPTEEVTYVFSVDDSPGRSPRKPQTFEEKLHSTRDGREAASIWRRGGRRTPHARNRYDNSIQTPGSADNKPLVSAQVMAVHDVTPEEEESVSLLDRYYRPVPSRRGRDGLLMLDDEDDDKGYTENFTVV